MFLQKPRYASIVVISVVLAWGLIGYSYAAGDDIKFTRDGYDFLQQIPNNPPPSDPGEEQIAFPSAEGFGKYARIWREIDCEMGRIINSVSDVEGWTSDSADVEYWHDSDLDGIPNEVENCMGLDPNYDDAFGDRDDDGYKNIEEYLNWLAGDQSLPCVYKKIHPELN